MGQVSFWNFSFYPQIHYGDICRGADTQGMFIPQYVLLLSPPVFISMRSFVWTLTLGWFRMRAVPNGTSAFDSPAPYGPCRHAGDRRAAGRKAFVQLSRNGIEDGTGVLSKEILKLPGHHSTFLIYMAWMAVCILPKLFLSVNFIRWKTTK